MKAYCSLNDAKLAFWLTCGVIIAISLLPVSSAAIVTFEKLYGGAGLDSGYCVQQTADGGYVITGCTTSFVPGVRAMYLVKTDSLANMAWQRTYNKRSFNVGRSVQQTSDHGYIVAGNTWSAGEATDIYLVRTDSLGNALWDTTYGGDLEDFAESVRQTYDGGYVVAGRKRLVGQSSDDLYLLKADPFGHLLWDAVYGGAYDDRGYSIMEIPVRAPAASEMPHSLPSYVIAGSTQSFGQEHRYDVYLVKTDIIGNLQWQVAYGDTFNEEGMHVSRTSDGGYVIAGYAERSSWEDTIKNASLTRLGPLGQLLWSRTYYPGENGYGLFAQQEADSGFVIVENAKNNVFLIRTNSNGNSLWAKTYSGFRASSAQCARDGGYVIAGSTKSFGAKSADVCLIKTDGNGSVFKDVGVISIDSPGDTVMCYTPYPVKATVKNLSGFLDTVQVRATVGNFDSRIRLRNLAPDSSVQVEFGNWTVPSADSVNYTLKITSSMPEDEDPSNDTIQKSLFAYHGLGPSIVEAFASDNTNPVRGIDSDDYVRITFNEPTNAPVITATNINTVLRLSLGHSWKDASNSIGGAVWTGASRLTIYLSTKRRPPTVAVGDTITPNGSVIKDLKGYPSIGSCVIWGSFDPLPGIGENGIAAQTEVFSLFQNNPNPFRGSTLITYSLPGPSSVTLEIYDIAGRVVKTLVDNETASNFDFPFSIFWDAQDEAGRRVPSGIYFCRLKAGDLVFTKKMVVVD
jgi:hypothetical protein